MRKNRFVLITLSVLLLVVMVSGCGGGEEPTVAVNTPTDLPVPTATAVPTTTPLPPTKVVVVDTPTAAPSDTPTRTVAPVSPTAEEAACEDLATFVNDVTIPDGMPIAAGTNFVKTWRIRNVGTCTWTTAYAAVFVGGDKMGDTESVPLPADVAPEETVDISASLTALDEPGTYRSHWKLQNADEVVFGTGPDHDKSFWVEIVVPALEAATPTATE